MPNTARQQPQLWLLPQAQQHNTRRTTAQGFLPFLLQQQPDVPTPFLPVEKVPTTPI